MRLTAEMSMVLAAACLLPGCVVIRALDDSVTGTLEQVPVLKAVGIESRKSIEQRKASAEGTAPTTGERGKGAASASVQAADPAMGKKLSLELLLCAARWVNPDERHHPAPIRLRLMELANANHFTTAPSAELMADNRPAAWAADIRDVRDVVVPPGGGIALGWLTSSDSMLGVAGDFRIDPDAPQTRLLLKLDDRPEAGWVLYARGSTLHLLARAPADEESDTDEVPDSSTTSSSHAAKLAPTTPVQAALHCPQMDDAALEHISKSDTP